MRRFHASTFIAVAACASWFATVQGQAPATPAIPNIAGRVLTVDGPIEPARLGHTLMHEHIFIDFTVPYDEPEKWRIAGRTRPTAASAVERYHAPLTMDILGAVTLGAVNRDTRILDDEPTAIAEVSEFRRHGGGTIVDVTSIGLKRNPEGLRRVARATGLNIVMGASWYTEAWYSKDLANRSVDSLTDEIVRDVTSGVGETGIRSGIIGEVGTSRNPDGPIEGKIIRASARASRLTGAAISLHSLGMMKQHAKILDMLAAEGADLSRVVMGHSDFLAGEVAYIIPLLQRGATIQFDLLGRPNTITRNRATDTDVAQTIVDLIKAGYGDRVVMSHDICTKLSLKSYGGTGYSYIEEQFIPYLKRQGVTDAQVNALVVDNPARILTFAAPKPAATVTTTAGR